MTPRPAVSRCEVCTARLTPDHPTGARRCGEHTDQIALFDPPTTRPRPPRRPRSSTPATSDTSGDRHPSRARRTRATNKDRS